MDWYNGSKEEEREESPSNCFSFHCAGGVEQRVDRNVQSAGFERPWWTYGEGWSSWGREQDATIPNEVVVLQPFNRTQFSTVVYLPMACIFIAFPKTNFVGAWPLTSDANESCGKTEWRPNSPDIASKCDRIGGSVIGRKAKIDCRGLYEKSPRSSRRWI